MRDFWLSSGHHLLDHDADGRLVVTDAFLKAYLARPELVPPPEACHAERALHADMLRRPRRTVSATDLAELADEDARENWELMLAFRDRLLAAPSLEAAYLDLVRNGVGRTPPLFLGQLAQLILRNALDDCDDAFVLRAAELFFRPQRATSHEGALLLADAEVIADEEARQHASPLLAMFSGPAVTGLDVLGVENAQSYFGRSDAFDFVLNFGDIRSRAGLATAMSIWIEHLLGIGTRIEPVAAMQDQDWSWFVGLDAEATRIGNALWKGREPSAEELSRVIGLFRLTFDEPGEASPEIGAKPVWLILATDRAGEVRVKPQNLIAGLPLRTSAEVN